MKRIIFLLVLIIVLAFFTAGCSSTMKEPPDISITIDNKEIDYVSAKNKWDGSVYDREDTFVTILNEEKDIPVFKNGSISKITFKTNPPDEFKIMDILIDENGRQIYTDKEIINIDVELNNGKCSFAIEKYLASFLSSQYESGEKDIRGFRLIASWGENECEYAFIIKTYEEESSEYLTGEIITDGDYEISSGGTGSFSFVPDKESREIIEEKYGSYDLYYLDDESYYLYYDEISVTENLPKELGIYKVKVIFDLKNIYNYDLFNINDIQLTDNIGTIIYEGKTYETNNLDLDVKVKDKVSGLIVDSVDKLGDEGFRVRFCGQIETEGYYNISYDELHDRNIGTIYYDDNYVNNVPMMMGETNNKQLFLFVGKEDLFRQLEDYSSFGRGKFKISNFHIVYNYGMGREPTEILTEIVSLDENYKDLFKYSENEISIMDPNEDYLIVAEHEINVLEVIKSTYYFVSRSEPSFIKIASSDNGFRYRFEKSNDDPSKKDGSDFNLVSYNHGNLFDDEKSAHTIKFKYFNKNDTGNYEDILTKDVNHGTFKNGENTIDLYEGNEFLNMIADDISVLYHCKENLPDELAWIRVRFTGEVTITGKLSVSIDDQFGYQVYFTADSESINKLPQHVEDTRDAGGIRFTNENLKEILGEEPFVKDCEITIKDFYIHYAATEAVNTAELVSVRLGE